METADYLRVILWFSSAYVLVAFYATWTKDHRTQQSIMEMTPTFFVSIVLMCATGLGYID